MTVFRKRKRGLLRNGKIKKCKGNVHLVAFVREKRADIVVEKDVEKKVKKVEKRC